ncbi:unnamed protein product [Oikopleura dioica]|uniref:Aspartic peptidase DDI1-type domain-containing protein n=1 Tax=Oikopleura dioica TaxID=34765 RepID=E4WXT2_OIKDI|nr:unnamed protein product [Oikopleura dioica]
MKLTITGPGDSIWSQDLSPDLDIGTLKMLSALDLNLDFNNMVFIANGQPLLNDAMKIEATGLKDGDMIMAMPGNFLNRASQTDLRQQANPRRQQVDWNAKAQEVLEQFRSQLGRLQNWPALQEAVRAGNLGEIARVLSEDHEKKVAKEERLRRAEANPMDPENQRILEEHIRQQNIDESLNTAMENSPELFGTVIMLYINCSVNDVPVKAFVDSGAQMTIMSQACAERCNCMRLLDTRFSGMAVGVGKQRILGRVHTGQIQIGDTFIPSSFSVMEDQPMDLLIGLDMLKRHQCVIDLATNELRIGSTGTTVKFLSEGELDSRARLAGPAAEQAQSEDMEIEKALAASKREAEDERAGPSSKRADTGTASKEIQQIMSTTKCSQDVAENALREAGGNMDSAVLTILTKSFSSKN